MSDEKDDLELEALQRRLDDAFGTTRPRRDFEDELWLRMQARRPATARLRDAFAAIVAGFREAPAIPLGAVAVLLIVAVGIGVVATGGLHFNQSSTTSGAFSQAAPAPADLAAGQFGRLPTPALHPGSAARVPSALTAGPEAPAVWSGANLYFGPANLRWTGQLPALVQAPVYRYAEPGVAVADQFGASLGASTSQKGTGALGYLGTYAGQGFSVSVQSTVPQLPREPYFVLTASGYNVSAVDEEAAATNFLDHFSLEPSWPNTIDAIGDPQQARVLLERYFAVLGGNAYVVDWNGERYGIEVDISNRQVQGASGPLPLALDSASYRLISSDQAVRTALASTSASTPGIQPVPTVNLDRVELVYALAVANGQGFYEPAYLFSGTFQHNGQTYTKRVLVPLVDPSQRS